MEVRLEEWEKLMELSAISRQLSAISRQLRAEG